MKNKEKGYVYVLTNPCIKEVDAVIGSSRVKVAPVKIGKTNDIYKRMGVLNTSLPENFVVRLCVEVDSYQKAGSLEGVVHDILKANRIKTRIGGPTEFFNCSLETAMDTVLKTAKKLKYNIKVRKDLDMLSRSALANEARQKVAGTAKKTAVKTKSDRAKPFRFSMIGIKTGDDLVFVPTGIPVKAVGENKVEYKGKTYSLSSFVAAFIDKPTASGAYQGPKYFTFNGKLLTDLRAEAEKK